MPLTSAVPVPLDELKETTGAQPHRPHVNFVQLRGMDALIDATLHALERRADGAAHGGRDSILPACVEYLPFGNCRR
jgi:hypothetical protein